MSHFHLDTAYHCENCNCVGDDGSACACCGSRSLLSLANLMDRNRVECQAVMTILRETVREVKGVLAEVVE